MSAALEERGERKLRTGGRAARSRSPERLPASVLRLGRESGVTFAVVEEGKRGSVPRVAVLEMRRQTVEVTGQEILTKVVTARTCSVQ